MRRKQLNGIAASIAGKFAASAEHFAHLAASHDCREVTINLLTLDISPTIFDIERNRNLAVMCANNLRTLLQQDELIEATLAARFDCQANTPSSRAIRWGVVEVRLVSPGGQEAVGRAENKPQRICP